MKTRTAGVVLFFAAVVGVGTIRAGNAARQVDALRATEAPPNAMWLDSLDLTKMVRTSAIGLFNRGLEATTMSATWAELGLPGSQPVRDLWLQRDLGAATDAFTTTVPAHGAMLVKIGNPRRQP